MSAKKGLMMMAVMLYFSTFVGCGSVGNNGSQGYSASSGTTAGKVGILIKDDLLAHPSSTSTDVPELSQLWVTINRVSLKMEDETENGIDDEMDDEGWLTVFEGTAKSYDLLTLQGNNMALMSLVDVPPGYYEKARLEIDEAPGKNCFYALGEGIADDPLNPCTDNDAYLLTVPSGKVDIEFKPQILIGPDTTQYIVFDLLPADSIKITDTSSEKGYLLRPEVHAYTMSSIMQDKGWDDVNVEELEGHIAEVSGCDNPDVPDTLILSPEHGDVDISIDITGTNIYLHDSDIPAACSSLQPGQELEVKFRISGDGTITVDWIEIEESFDKECGHDEDQYDESEYDMDDDLTGDLKKS